MPAGPPLPRPAVRRPEGCMTAVYSAFFGSEAPGRRREAGVDTAAREAYNNPAPQTAARPGGGFLRHF